MTEVVIPKDDAEVTSINAYPHNQIKRESKLNDNFLEPGGVIL